MAAASSRRSLLLAALVALALSLAGAGSARAADPSTSSIGALRICSSCASTGGNLSRYRYVVLNSWDAPLLPALKAQNPGLKALVYKNLDFSVSYSCSGGVDSAFLTAGVGYCDANANHPDWFLTDPSGQRLTSSAFPQAWMMDVGNPAYQDRWIANVSADLHAGGWDGVFVDDTNASMNFHLNGRTIAKYPTDASWRAATRSMLSRMGPALTSGGFLVIPNLYTPWMADYDSLATWKDWIQFTSGAAQEFFTKWGTTNSGRFAGSDWTYRQSFQAATEDAGKIFLGITYAPKADARSMQYARANFLLFEGASSKSALIYEASDPEAQDPFSAQWTGDVGSPSGPRFQVGAAWRRNFSGGTVLVNPSTSTVTVDLGQPYVDANGAVTSSVSLAPTTGAVLTTAAGAAGGTPPPPPGPPPPTPAPPAPAPSPAQIWLTATAVGNAVQLTWLGMPATRVDVYRNGGKIANVANSGSYRDQLSRNANGTFAYRVCAAGTSTCSAKVSVVVRRVKLATAGTLSSWQVLLRLSFRPVRS